MMKLKFLFRDISLWLYLFCSAIVVGATVYQMFVIIPEFERDAPNGMIAFAQSNVDPRNFWTSPIGLVSHLIMIAALVVNWKTARRKWLLFSIAFVVAAVVVTIVFFIPRLQIMGLIDDKVSGDTNLLKQAIKEWVIGDIFRFWCLVVPGFFFGLKAASVSLVKEDQKKTAISRRETSIAV